MTPEEVLWRVRSGVRDRADRLLLGSRQHGRALAEVFSGGNGLAIQPVSGMQHRELAAALACPLGMSMVASEGAAAMADQPELVPSAPNAEGQ